MGQDGMVGKEGWRGRDRKIQVDRQIERQGGGRTRVSTTWSHSPEKNRNKQKQEARTKQTSLNYRAET